MTEAATIINVDDNEAARYVKTRTLVRAGFVVYEAATGSEGLRSVAEHNPDLVLLDVNLPDVHGIEVCRRIKSSSSGSSVIVLQISASAITVPHATAALDGGADAYLIEPVAPEILVATVRALLRLQKAERELSAANERLHILNHELQRSNEDLQQFAFAASHDLQEPLRTIASFVGLLERTARAKLTGAELEYLAFVSDGSHRMQNLIADLLSYSQVGQKPAPFQTVDLKAVLPWTIENLRELVDKSNAVITWDTLPCVTGDEAQLGQVLQNLIGNAIKYGRPGLQPVIHLSASRENDDWLVRVRDNGIGIESKHFQLIFAPFKRLHGREISGTGIGLAICRRMIEAHGGNIWVESSPNEGSTFCFTVPVHPVRGELDPPVS
jgi:two-component system sensor histidine kinase/response regulator